MSSGIHKVALQIPAILGIVWYLHYIERSDLSNKSSRLCRRMLMPIQSYVLLHRKQLQDFKEDMESDKNG